MSHKSNCTAEEETSLVAACREAMAQSYRPYSHFPVGAALLTKQGKVFTGCSVENVAFTGSICAERTAIVKAVSEGYREFKAIAISSKMDSFIAPCGSCRQTMTEFSPDMTVYMTRSDGTFHVMSARELLPFFFGPEAQTYRWENLCPEEMGIPHGSTEAAKLEC